MSTTTKLGQADLRELAVAASVDPRTIDKVLSGGTIRPMSLARIRKALEARGLGHLLPPASAGAGLAGMALPPVTS